jgi:cytochrome c553
MARSRHRAAIAALTALALLGVSPTAGADGLGHENAPPQEICGMCHGLDGISRMAKFPKLAGQKAAYLERQIRDFRDGRRHNDGGQMAAVATEIAETQIAEVAAYFASLPPPQPAGHDPASRTRAEALFNAGDPVAGIPACRGCHGPGPTAGEGSRIEGPHLSAQHADYLARQLADFRSGTRTNDPGEVMQRAAARLSDSDIAALARFLAASPRERMPQEPRPRAEQRDEYRD